MRAELANLNFREIVDYGGQPVVRNRYTSPLQCGGYCVDCEESGVLASSSGVLTLMSHACDSADYESILGPMPSGPAPVHAPVLFLLEDPGADSRYHNGEVVAFRGQRKKPPVNHYYWTPSARPWPQRIGDFISDQHFYGPYFAYLMARHQLQNVYITNLVKCKWGPVAGQRGNASLVNRHCTSRFLAREFALFQPALVVSFGGAAQKGFKEFSRSHGVRVDEVNLLHPAYIKNRSQTDPQKRSKEQLFQENDLRVESALGGLANKRINPTARR